jgi:hypothetical protein
VCSRALYNRRTPSPMATPQATTRHTPRESLKPVLRIEALREKALIRRLGQG